MPLQEEAMTEGIDEHGRGPLQREYHRRLGYDPTKRPIVGFAQFADAVELAMKASAMDFPTRFQPMMRAAIEDILAVVLPGMIDKLVEEKLVPVRKAYAELKAIAGKPVNVRVQSPQIAVPVRQ
jgi:hypothetical protein